MWISQKRSFQERSYEHLAPGQA